MMKQDILRFVSFLTFCFNKVSFLSNIAHILPLMLAELSLITLT